jgi:hypothetical protein
MGMIRKINLMGVPL